MTQVSRLLAVRGSVRAASATSNQTPAEPAEASAQPAIRRSRREQACLGERRDDPAHSRRGDARQGDEQSEGRRKVQVRAVTSTAACRTASSETARGMSQPGRKPAEPELRPHITNAGMRRRTTSSRPVARARALVEDDAAGEPEDRPSGEQRQDAVGQRPRSMLR